MAIGILNGNTYGSYVIQATIDVASVAANTTAEQTFTIPGLRLRDFVAVNKPSLSAGLGVVNARVSAADTLALTFSNSTAGAINPAPEVYTISITRAEGSVLPVGIGD